MNYIEMNPTFLYITHLHARIREVWLPVVGFPKYEVSSEGVIRNKKTQDIVKSHVLHDGYLMLKLYVDDTAKSESVHRTVCRAFWPNPDKLPCVSHIDGNKMNNNIRNLKWVSRDELNSYLISFKRSDGKFRCYNSHTHEITTEDLLPRNVHSRFIMLNLH